MTVFTNSLTFSNLVRYEFLFVFFPFRAGGPWLVTDMDRIESIFEIDPSLQVILL